MNRPENLVRPDRIAAARLITPIVQPRAAIAQVELRAPEHRVPPPGTEHGVARPAR
jgi:hypothetical protein